MPTEKTLKGATVRKSGKIDKRGKWTRESGDWGEPLFLKVQKFSTDVVPH